MFSRGAPGLKWSSLRSFKKSYAVVNANIFTDHLYPKHCERSTQDFKIRHI